MAASPSEDDEMAALAAAIVQEMNFGIKPLKKVKKKKDKPISVKDDASESMSAMAAKVAAEIKVNPPRIMRQSTLGLGSPGNSPDFWKEGSVDSTP